MARPTNDSIEKTIEVLLENPGLTVTEIAGHTGISVSNMRLILKMAHNQLDVDTSRQPYAYSVKASADIAKRKEFKQRAKKAMLSADNSEMPVIEYIRSIPKTSWVELSFHLGIFAEAIEELDKEGKLIDTL